MERRIVLFGPPLCGKRTLMRMNADSQRSELAKATVACGSESMPHEVNRVWLAESHTELVTIGGAVWNMDAWWSLLVASQAVVLMLDSQAVRESADREHIDALAGAPNLPDEGCVVWTKDDLVTTHGLERAALSVSEILHSSRTSPSNSPFRSNGKAIANWPSFSTRMDVWESMLAPISYLMNEPA